MKRSYFIFCGALGFYALAACNSDTSDVGANPSAGASGKGTAGSAGSAGSNAQAGQGGSAGTSAQAGTAGQGGSAGSAQGGSAQGGAGQGGSAGQAQAGTAGQSQGGSAGNQAIEQAKSNKDRETAAVSEADQAAVVEGNTAFAIDLYGKLRAEPANAGKNIWFSPLSITLALGMTSSGAKGETQAQIAKALHFTLPQASLQPALNWLSLELARRPQQAKDFAKSAGSNVEPEVTLNLVNAVWGEKTDQWQTGFLDVLAQYYGAGVYLGDFKKNADGERKTINQWVSDQTEKRIEDLIPEGSLDSATRLVLVNAINLTFGWMTPFDAKNTKPSPFTPEGGSAITVDTMAQQLDYVAYAEDTMAQSLAMPLLGNKMSVVIYLPKAGQLSAFESQLASEVSSLKAAEKNDGAVKLEIPRFKFTTPSVKLKPALQSLGMSVPFTGSADFSGMTTTEPLFVSEVYHKAMLGIDEKGVQAAAATAVGLSGGGIPPTPVPMKVDRSFLVGIRDDATGALLFFGRVIDPSQT